MRKFDDIIQRYTQEGVSMDNIDFAIESVKEGSKREHIVENLTASYRGMPILQAHSLLEELFHANGGEFKKENRGGYLFGSMFLLIGIPCIFYIIYVFVYGGVLIRPVLVFAAAITFTTAGITLIVKSITGKFRDSDAPGYEH